jgi:hypothetical protein
MLLFQNDPTTLAQHDWMGLYLNPTQTWPDNAIHVIHLLGLPKNRDAYLAATVERRVEILISHAHWSGGRPSTPPLTNEMIDDQNSSSAVRSFTNSEYDSEADSHRISPIRQPDSPDVFDFSLWRDLLEFDWNEDEAVFRSTELILEHGQRMFIDDHPD